MDFKFGKVIFRTVVSRIPEPELKNVKTDTDNTWNHLTQIDLDQRISSLSLNSRGFYWKPENTPRPILVLLIMLIVLELLIILR